MINSIGFALDPTNVPSFLLDWEVTKLCNLDCSYCGTGIDGGHDNSTKHPPLDKCLETIDFMYEYVDLYMSYKKPSQRKAVLNVYGGESLFHPDIVCILEESRSKYTKYKDKWHLTITCTTNGVVGSNRWANVVPLVDEFTMSYHSEMLPKQKQQFFNNALYLKTHNKKFKCVIMMHNRPELFADSENAVEFCKQHHIPYLVKPLDNTSQEWAYSQEQFFKLKTFWISKVNNKQKLDYVTKIESLGSDQQVQSINEGRACCGGRKLSINSDLKSSVSFVPQQGFKDWYCSVNWFFLFVRQFDGAVYTNKDCRTSTTGRVEPLGNLDNQSFILDTLKKQLDTGNMPIIKCVKDICLCGFCSPKANNIDDFKKLIGRNLVTNIFDKEPNHGKTI